MEYRAMIVCALMTPVIASSEDFTNSLLFVDSVSVMANEIIVTDRNGIGKLPAGKMDSTDNVTYSRTNAYRIGDCIRSQGGQHNCYWEVQAISNGFVKLHFFGHIRGFGSQDCVFWTSDERKEKSQPPLRRLERQGGASILMDNVGKTGTQNRR